MVGQASSLPKPNPDLAHLDALNAKIIIPGHGPPMHGEKLLHATLELLRRESELARAAKADGRSAAEACKAILADDRVKAL